MRVPEGGIHVRGLVKEFPGVRALDGLDLDVPPGMLYGLVGPNGSGKTTLIRILTGLSRPTAGAARVMGAAPGRRAREIGYMPQEEALYDDLSVMENLAFFAGLYGVDARTRAHDALRFVGLWDARDRVVAHLSGGMRRRASLATALLHEPAVLLLDEPTVGVDPLLRRGFWRFFEERASRGVSLLITTHHMEEARRCHRLGLLWRGRRLWEGAPDELLAQTGARSLDDAFAQLVERAGGEAA